MLAPHIDQDLAEQLKGTQQKSNTATPPSSPWVHGLLYVGYCLIVLAGCMFVVAVIDVIIEVPHLAEPNHAGMTWTDYLVTVAILCVLPFLVVWGRARVIIGTTINLQRQFACTYRDARYITERAALRVIADTVSDPHDFQKLVAYSRYLDSLREFLPVIEHQLKELKPYQNEYANRLRDSLEQQRADILARV